MTKFNYDNFRKDIRESAEESDKTPEEFITDFDKDLGVRAPTKKCISIIQLYKEEARKNPELVKHVKGCNYCRRLIKVLFFTCCRPKEKLAVVNATFPDPKTRPSFKVILSIFKKKLPDDCYELGGFLHWNRLSEELKSHRKSCKRCAAIMEFIQKMELPELT